MKIRWNSIVLVAAILAVLVFVQVMPAEQAPAAQGQGGAAAPAAGAPAQGQGAGRGGAGRGGGGGGGGRGGAAAVPAGPVPRLANGKPDMTGLWANPYTANMAGGGRGGRGAAGAPVDLNATSPSVLDPTTRQPFNWDLKGTPIAESKGEPKTFDLPYTAWGRKQWADYDPVANGDYAGNCFPFGMSRNINSPHGVQIMQHVDFLAFLFEQNTWHQLIPLTDKRKWPADLPVAWNGVSTARWDGDTLIIETTKFNGYTRLDTAGHPHSKELKLINTFTMTDSNTINHTVTVHDPKTYTRDWMNVRVWRQKPANDVLMEYSCEENNLGLFDGAIKRWQIPENID
jgi:hypothetical protein